MKKIEEKFLELARTARKENRQIDFKESIDLQSSQDWARIIKDIIAMANSGGGIILFGIKDDGSYSKFDRNIILDIDPAVMADKILSYTKEDFSDFEIVEVIRNKRKVVALIVSAAPTPIVFTRAGTDVLEGGKQKSAFARGSVYFRHGAKSEPGTTTDIKNAIDRVVGRFKKNWFQGIRKIANIQDGEEVVVSRKDSFGSVKPVQKVLGKIVADKSAPSFRLENPREVWPFRMKDAVDEINKNLNRKKIINNHDILCIRKQYNVNETTKPEYVYKPYQDLSPRYSIQFTGWVTNSYKRNSRFFDEAREYFKKSKQHHA